MVASDHSGDFESCLRVILLCSRASAVGEERFMKEQKETLTTPDYGFHGTRAANIPSILSTGLRVPGQESGVRVANGSAHGVGIYTGMPGRRSSFQLSTYSYT